MPGVLQIEAMAQLGGFVALQVHLPPPSVCFSLSPSLSHLSRVRAVSPPSLPLPPTQLAVLSPSPPLPLLLPASPSRALNY